jgi:hypothetical protein
MVSHEPYGAYVIVSICYMLVNTPFYRRRRCGTRELLRPMTSLLGSHTARDAYRTGVHIPTGGNYAPTINPCTDKQHLIRLVP